MDMFYHELMFELLAIGIEFAIAVAMYYLVKLVWATASVVVERRSKKKQGKRDMQERLTVYSDRSAEYRKECMKCYRQE